MKTLIIGNWKMNPQAPAKAKLLFDSIKRGIKDVKNVEIVICPPFVYLTNLQQTTNNLQLGAQDCYWEEEGAFTGEVSPLMLKNLGVKYVIIGHSERRRHLNETDEIINKKLKAALKQKLKPILCIGEIEKERKAGKTLDVLKRQLKYDLKSVFNFKSNILNLTIAYEPVWAIGTGKACGISEAKEINLFIRKTVGNSPRIIYGGSVNSQNARSFILEAKFQGLLPGSASLNPQEFIGIIKNVG